MINKCEVNRASINFDNHFLCMDLYSLKNVLYPVIAKHVIFTQFKALAFCKICNIREQGNFQQICLYSIQLQDIWVLLIKKYSQAIVFTVKIANSLCNIHWAITLFSNYVLWEIAYRVTLWRKMGLNWGTNTVMMWVYHPQSSIKCFYWMRKTINQSEEVSTCC